MNNRIGCRGEAAFSHLYALSKSNGVALFGTVSVETAITSATCRIRTLMLPKEARALAEVMLISLLLLAGCAKPMMFKPGTVSAQQFESDKTACRSFASSTASAAENQAERYETKSGAEMVGAGVAAMVTSAYDKARFFDQCMKSRGYRP